MKPFYFLSIFVLCAVLAQAQTSKSSYNLPPNAKILPKVETDKDLSFKLQRTPDFDQVDEVEKQFKHFLTEKNYQDMLENDMGSYNYYKTAEDYFDNLSDKVKALFTADDIWYIYYFDDSLKNNLLTVK